jgi:hypothetical protein
MAIHAWGIHDGKRLRLETIRATEALCKAEFTKLGVWDSFEAKGFRCIPITVEGRKTTDRFASGGAVDLETAT